MDYLLGALTLWILQGLYRLGRDRGAVSDVADEDNKRWMHTLIRQAPRDPRADISRAQQARWWN